MRSRSTVIVILPLAALALSCHAGPIATLQVKARVVRACTAYAGQVTGCSAETLRYQSTLAGSANIETTHGDTPSVRFIGPQPRIEETRDSLNIYF
ncbi:MAG: hypothetical protein PVH25_14525 [Burkholderiales bacterium]